jgi:hypothetical protein
MKFAECKLGILIEVMKFGCIVPKKHKNTWRGHDKVVALGLPEQELIAPRLVGKSPEQAVFSPKDEVKEKKKNTRKRKRS